MGSAGRPRATPARNHVEARLLIAGKHDGLIDGEEERQNHGAKLAVATFRVMKGEPLGLDQTKRYVLCHFQQALLLQGTLSRGPGAY